MSKYSAVIGLTITLSFNTTTKVSKNRPVPGLRPLQNGISSVFGAFHVEKKEYKNTRTGEEGI